MKVLREKVKKLAKAELVMANEQFPLFHSDHEGVAVLLEEATEAREDMDWLEKKTLRLMRAVFEDASYDVKRNILAEIEMLATELACEAIQVSAMASKFRMSHKEEKNEPGNIDR